jgi:hypothetical protein
MSDKKTQKVKVIDKDKIIKAEIPGIFYYRFNKMLAEHFEYKDKEHFQKVMADLKEGKQETPLAYHVYTVMAFQVLLEDLAEEQGLMEEIEIDLETGERISIEKTPQAPQSQSTPE